MPTNHTRVTRPTHRMTGSLALGVAAVALALAACSAAVAADPGTDDQAPVPSPTSAPIGTPIPAPSDGGGDAMPMIVDLENATGADVDVDVIDHTGTLADAVSGTPGDGASVEPYTLLVENVDDRTLRLTWVDFPIDNDLALFIDETTTGLRFVLVQPEPTESSDAMAFDRILELTFDAPVSAGQVEAILQDGLDTPG
jgi:hypothetical protein